MTISPNRRKFTPETIETITNEIRQSGIEKLGYELAGIPKRSYLRWKKEHPEFKAEIDRALAEYRKEKAPEIRNKVERAKRYLDGTLDGTEYQEVTEENFDSVGRLVERTTRRKRILPPDWYLRKLILDTEDSQQITVTIGVASPDDVASQQDDDSLYLDDQDQYSDFDGSDEDNSSVESVMS